MNVSPRTVLGAGIDLDHDPQRLVPNAGLRPRLVEVIGELLATDRLDDVQVRNLQNLVDLVRLQTPDEMPSNIPAPLEHVRIAPLVEQLLHVILPEMPLAGFVRVHYEPRRFQLANGYENRVDVPELLERLRLVGFFTRPVCFIALVVVSKPLGVTGPGRFPNRDVRRFRPFSSACQSFRRILCGTDRNDMFAGYVTRSTVLTVRVVGVSVERWRDG